MGEYKDNTEAQRKEGGKNKAREIKETRKMDTQRERTDKNNTHAERKEEDKNKRKRRKGNGNKKGSRERT